MIFHFNIWGEEEQGRYRKECLVAELSGWSSASGVQWSGGGKLAGHGCSRQTSVSSSGDLIRCPIQELSRASFLELIIREALISHS